MLEQLKLYLNLLGEYWWASSVSIAGDRWGVWRNGDVFIVSIHIPGETRNRQIACHSLESIIAALEPVLCAKK